MNKPRPFYTNPEAIKEKSRAVAEAEEILRMNQIHRRIEQI